jgi:hypothetical protein
VAAPVAEIFPVDLSIERFREQMIHTAHILVFTPGSVAAAFQLVGKVLRTLAARRLREGDELSWQEVSGISGYQVQEPCLRSGVAQGFQGADVVSGDFHRERMSAVSSC